MPVMSRNDTVMAAKWHSVLCQRYARCSTYSIIFDFTRRHTQTLIRISWQFLCSHIVLGHLEGVYICGSKHFSVRRGTQQTVSMNVCSEDQLSPPMIFGLKCDGIIIAGVLF